MDLPIVLMLLLIVGVLIISSRYLYEKYLYNKGICRKCGHKLNNIMRGDTGEIHKCENCKKSIYLRIFGTPYKW